MKINKFFKDRFDLWVLVSYATLIILIAIFILLSTLQKPHVRFFEFTGAEINNADFKNQRLKIFFSSPMNKDNTQDLVTITPSHPFRTAWSANNLFIIFENSLRSDTEYTISFKSEFKDLYGESIDQTRNNINFRTKPSEFLFTRSDGNSSGIYRSDTEFKSEKIYSDGIIKKYDAGSNYVVIVNENIDKTNDITILNLQTLEKERLNLSSKIISDMAYSPTSEEFSYIIQSVSKEETYLIPEGDTEIRIYSITSREDKVLFTGGSSDQPVSLNFTPDGNSIIFKNAQSGYNILGISENSSVTLLGRYLAFGDFSYDGETISFIDFDALDQGSIYQYIVEIDTDRVEKKISDGSVGVLDPEYFNNSYGVIFSEKYKELETTKGYHRIVVDKGDDKSVLLEDENNSLELPKLSYDDRYLLIESYSESDLLNFQNQRLFDFQTKPSNAYIKLYDFEKGEVIDRNIRGFNIVWLR